MCSTTSPTFTTCRVFHVSPFLSSRCTRSTKSTRPHSPPTKKPLVFSPRRWRLSQPLPRPFWNQRSQWSQRSQWEAMIMIMMIIAWNPLSIAPSIPPSIPLSIPHPFRHHLPATPSVGVPSSASSLFVWAFRSWQPTRFFSSHFYSRRNSPKRTRNVVPRQPQDTVFANGSAKQHTL